ncbi:hypothetical protein BJX96DRAFT_14796 [Aspergillus floccosus]
MGLQKNRLLAAPVHFLLLSPSETMAGFHQVDLFSPVGCPFGSLAYKLGLLGAPQAFQTLKNSSHSIKRPFCRLVSHCRGFHLSTLCSRPQEGLFPDSDNLHLVAR